MLPVTRDEGIREDTSLEKLAALQPAFKNDGVITAGNSSQISDGAAAVLIMSEDKARTLGLTPKARFVAFPMVGVDPVTMLTGPIPATEKVLERAGLGIDEIDLFEVNEAFAAVTVAWRMEHGGSDPMALWERTNLMAGIALGHPLGARGVRVLTTLVWELERTGGLRAADHVRRRGHGQRPDRGATLRIPSGRVSPPEGGSTAEGGERGIGLLLPSLGTEK